MKKTILFLIVLTLISIVYAGPPFFPIAPTPYADYVQWINESNVWYRTNATGHVTDYGVVLNFNTSMLSAGAGDITAVYTPDDYLLGGSDTGDVSLILNESYLNGTIDARATGGVGGNPFNQSLNTSDNVKFGGLEIYNETSRAMITLKGNGSSSTSAIRFHDNYTNPRYWEPLVRDTGTLEFLRYNETDYLITLVLHNDLVETRYPLFIYSTDRPGEIQLRGLPDAYNRVLLSMFSDLVNGTKWLHEFKVQEFAYTLTFYNHSSGTYKTPLKIYPRGDIEISNDLYVGGQIYANETTIGLNISGGQGSIGLQNNTLIKKTLNVTGITTLYSNLDATGNNLTNMLATKYNITGCEEVDTTDEGLVCWNPNDYTLNVVTGLGNVIQVGQELSGVGKNNQGETIYNGQIVYQSGTQGEQPLIQLADASNGSKISNVAMVTIPFCNNNAPCPVTTYGFVRDLDTSAFAEGDSIYLKSDGSGNFTNAKQPFPYYNIRLGRVVRSHANAGIVLFLPEIDYGDGVTIHNLGILENLTVLGYINASNFLNNGTNLDSLYVNRTGDTMTGKLTLDNVILNLTQSSTSYIEFNNDDFADPEMCYYTDNNIICVGIDDTNDAFYFSNSSDLETGKLLRLDKDGDIHIPSGSQYIFNEDDFGQVNIRGEGNQYTWSGFVLGEDYLSGSTFGFYYRKNITYKHGHLLWEYYHWEEDEYYKVYSISFDGNQSIPGSVEIGKDLYVSGQIYANESTIGLNISGGKGDIGFQNNTVAKKNLKILGFVNSTGDINSSGRICDGSGNCLDSVDTYNTTQEMIDGVNTTELLINWSHLIIDTYNTTQQMITAVNTTGFVINWSHLIVDTNLSEGGNVTGTIDMNGNNILDLGNITFISGSQLRVGLNEMFGSYIFNELLGIGFFANWLGSEDGVVFTGNSGEVIMGTDINTGDVWALGSVRANDQVNLSDNGNIDLTGNQTFHAPDGSTLVIRYNGSKRWIIGGS